MIHECEENEWVMDSETQKIFDERKKRLLQEPKEVLYEALVDACVNYCITCHNLPNCTPTTKCDLTPDKFVERVKKRLGLIKEEKKDYLF